MQPGGPEVAETCLEASKPELGRGLQVGAVNGRISRGDLCRHPGNLTMLLNMKLVQLGVVCLHLFTLKTVNRRLPVEHQFLHLIIAPLV
jgi:hypothetical protein